jgi:hypothetical protein
MLDQSSFTFLVMRLKVNILQPKVLKSDLTKFLWSGWLIEGLLQAVLGLRERYFGPSYELLSHDKVGLLFWIQLYTHIVSLEMKEHSYHMGIYWGMCTSSIL